MSLIVPADQLPTDLPLRDAVDAAYPEDLDRITHALRQRLSVLVECDKEIAPLLYVAVRNRLKSATPEPIECRYLDGRTPPPGSQEMAAGIVGITLLQMRDSVRGAVDNKVLVLPHLDLLATTTGALTAEAREVIPLLYENPDIVWLGFRDPTFPLPRVIERIFPRHVEVIGLERDRLAHLVTERESRKLSSTGGLNTYALYKHVSGLNVARLRRLLESMTGVDYPDDPAPAFRQIRQATLEGSLELPDISLHDDIGGYAAVKDRLQQEIIDLLKAKDAMSDEASIKRVEGLLPRGMIFWGPPGTGKTLFAKALATALGAAVTVVSGPELKSRWFGESEERLRSIFVRARRAAPALIIFDELDSFAASRGFDDASGGARHSMVNQLLTEMDGFRPNEMVFVIGTTNFVESLDPALLRPGRFEFMLHIPYPAEKDRLPIIGYYDKKFALHMSTDAVDYTVRRTGDPTPDTGSPYAGDHIRALLRTVARERMRTSVAPDAATEPPDIDRAIEKWIQRPELTSLEEIVVATHESGHAICALNCEKSPPIDRISIRGDVGGAIGFVQYSDPAHRYVVTERQLRDNICTLLGGREAERLLTDDVSIGAQSDLQRATAIARALVEQFALGGADGPGNFNFPQSSREYASVSDAMRERSEAAAQRILNDEQARAASILSANRESLEALRDLLLKEKVVDARSIGWLQRQKPAAASD
jgi:cell division protease FtsH